MAENNQLDILQGGHNSWKYFDSGKAISAGNWKIAYFQEDAVITTFTDTADVNQITLGDISGETIKAGVVLFAQNSKGIKALSVSSGSGFVFGTME
jgi:hypothetical protein